MKHKPLRVVITGASSGIGAATAVAFARQGAHVVLGARGKAGLEDVARRCRAVGGTAAVRIVDVTDAADVASFAANARALLGGIDLWFSNVGIGAVGKYQDVPIADHQRVIEANLIGHMNDAHAVLPIFRQQRHGIFVNMISVGGYLTSPFAASYAASKFGLRAFSAALRAELQHQRDIHICDVYPTFVNTPALGHTANYTGASLSWPPGAIEPEQVADAVVGLARHPRATTVVGAPASALKFGELATPATAALMNRFMETWARRARPTHDTTGSLYAPPSGASGIHGEPQAPARQHGTLLALGAAVAAAVLGASLVRRG